MYDAVANIYDYSSHVPTAYELVEQTILRSEQNTRRNLGA